MQQLAEIDAVARRVLVERAQRRQLAGEATRPSGIVGATLAMRPVAALPGVSTQPGAMLLTTMLLLASSTASDLVMEMTAFA